jgi:chromosome segregation ATPase
VTNVTLHSRLDELSSQLAAKVAALEAIESQRDELTKQAAELKTLVTSLKQRLEQMNVELRTAKNEAEAAKATADADAQQLQAKLAAGDRQAEAYLADLRRATEMLESLKLEKQQLQSELTAAERQRQADLLAEAENNRELVGLKVRCAGWRSSSTLLAACGRLEGVGQIDGPRPARSPPRG